MSTDPFAAYRVAPSNATNQDDPFAQYRVNNKTSSRGLGAEALRQVGRTGRLAATGIAGLADIPNLVAMGAHAAGLKETPTFYEPVAGKVQQGIDTLTGGYFKPENKTEEYIDMIGEGLAPMALAPLTGGASLTGTAARGLAKHGVKSAEKIAKAGAKTYAPTAANMAQSVGSSAALKAYLDEGGDPGLVGPLLASMAGGVGARGAVSAAKNIARSPMGAVAETAGRLTGFSPEKYAKNAELGLPVSLAETSKSILPSYLELAAAKMPGSMGPLEKFYKKREAAIARNLGVQHPEDLEKTVEKIPSHLAREGAKKFHEEAVSTYKKGQEKVLPLEKDIVKNKGTVDVSDLINELEADKSEYINKAEKKDFNLTGEGKLLKKLKDYSLSEKQEKADLIRKEMESIKAPEEMINKAIKSELGEIPNKEKRISYKALNKLRKDTFDEVQNLKNPIGEKTESEVKANIRYGMLSKKREQFIEQKGSPEQIKSLKEANKYWSNYKNKDNGLSQYVADITGEKSDVKGFDKLINDDPKYLRIALGGLDKKGKKELTSGIMEDLGTRQGRFSITTAYTNFNKKHHGFRNEFLNATPNKSAIEKTMKLIGENKRMMEKLANTSNTAHSKHLIDQMKRYGTAGVAAATGYGLTGLLGLTLETAGLYAGARIWTDQGFLRRVNEAILASNKRSKAHKIDMLLKTIEQTGVHTKHINKED